MNERANVYSLVEDALNRSRQDLPTAELKRGREQFILYLRDNILYRIERGKSADCDEYRTLLRIAGKAS